MNRLNFLKTLFTAPMAAKAIANKLEKHEGKKEKGFHGPPRVGPCASENKKQILLSNSDYMNCGTMQMSLVDYSCFNMENVNIPLKKQKRIKHENKQD